jgi:RNA polymerase sigma-70 factor (ECF subfamily)
MQIQEQIVRGFIAGNTEAFHALYAATNKALYGLIFRMTGNKQEAEDLLHDAYVRMYERRQTFDSKKSALYTWMYRVTVNNTLNSLRTKKRWDQGVVLEDMAAAVLEESVDTDDIALVQRVLEKMNPDFRVCLVLAEVEQKSYAEIAKLLAVSIGTVRSRISRGKAQLKKLFKAQGGEV